MRDSLVLWIFVLLVLIGVFLTIQTQIASLGYGAYMFCYIVFFILARKVLKNIFG